MVDDIKADQNAYVQIQTEMNKIENRVEDLIVLKGHLVLEELIRHGIGTRVSAILFERTQHKFSDRGFGVWVHAY
jgi:hypothetical protein